MTKIKSFILQPFTPLTQDEGKFIWNTIKGDLNTQLEQTLEEESTKSKHTMVYQEKKWIITNRSQLRIINKILKKDIEEDEKSDKIRKFLQETYFEELYKIIEHKLDKAVKKVYESNDELESSLKRLSLKIKPLLKNFEYEMMTDAFNREVLTIQTEAVIKINLKIEDLNEQDDDESDDSDKDKLNTIENPTEAPGTDSTPVPVTVTVTVPEANGSEEEPKVDVDEAKPQKPEAKPKGPAKSSNQKAKGTRRK